MDRDFRRWKDSRGGKTQKSWRQREGYADKIQSDQKEKRDSMNNVDEALEQLIDAILNSDTYRRYDAQRNLVKQEPGLKERIDEFRRRNYELQNGSDYAFDKLDEFEREYADFRENPLVSDFLATELAFCRMIQDINIRITAAVNFE